MRATAAVLALSALFVLSLSLQLHLAAARPTIYVKNENDKLEPVLVPVSSTVIPLPVYRVAYGLVGVDGGEGGAQVGGARKRPPGEHTLITVSKKKGNGKSGGTSPKLSQDGEGFHKKYQPQPQPA